VGPVARIHAYRESREIRLIFRNACLKHMRKENTAFAVVWITKPPNPRSWGVRFRNSMPIHHQTSRPTIAACPRKYICTSSGFLALRQHAKYARTNPYGFMPAARSQQKTSVSATQASLCQRRVAHESCVLERTFALYNCSTAPK